VTQHCWLYNWQAWLLDKDFKPVHRLTHLRNFRIDWGLRDDGAFTATMPVSSEQYAYLNPEVDQFLYVRRSGSGETPRAQVFKIESYISKWRPIRGHTTKTVELAGRGGNGFFLNLCIIQADPADPTMVGLTYTGTADDVIKQFIRYGAVVGTAYDDPDAEARGIPGLSVTADASESGTTLTDCQRRGNLWEVVEQLCLEHDVDLTFTPTWNGAAAAVTFEVDTHVGGRGADKTPGNANPVVLSDVYRVLKESAWHVNAFPLRTHAYSINGHDVQSGNDAADHLRAEVYVKTEDGTKLDETLNNYKAERGHTFTFCETMGVQLGRDFWLGDTLSHHDTVLNTEIKSELLAWVTIQIRDDAVGSEDIELVFGDEKPRSTKGNTGGGRRSKDVEPPGEASTVTTHDLLNGLVHADTVAADPHVGSLIVGVTVGEGAGWDELVIGTNGAMMVSNGIMAVWQGDVTRGDLWVGIEGPTWGNLAIGTATYVVKSDGTDVGWGQVDWSELTNVPSSFTPAAHDLLSASHGDTDPQAVTQGSIIIANATPAWTELVIGADNKVLKSDGTTASWDNVDYTELTNVPSSFTAAAHDLLSASHGDTTADSVVEGDLIVGYGSPAAWMRLAKGDQYKLLTNRFGWLTWETQNLLSAMHPDTVAHTVARGDIIVANSTPKYAALAIGSADYVLKSNGTDAAWGQVGYDELTDVPASFTASAHNLLDGSVHGDTLADTPNKGSLIVGTETPKWDEFVVGSVGDVLRVGGILTTGLVWSTPSSDVSGGETAILTSASGSLTLQHGVAYDFRASVYYGPSGTTNLLDLDNSTTSLDIPGSIVMDESKQVDGIDVSAHVHQYYKVINYSGLDKTINTSADDGTVGVHTHAILLELTDSAAAKNP